MVTLVPLGVLTLAESRARAQVQAGQIQGVVTSDQNGKPLPGVTITLSGPALQEDQAEVTSPDGRYLLTQLPPGDDYVVRFYLGDLVVERPGVRITQGRTLTISVVMPLKKMTREVKVIKERAPNVDTASASAGIEINQDILKSTAVRGRTYESVLVLAPGAIDPPRGRGGDVGVSISGSTGNENSFLIDGLNTSDPNSGILATELHQYFLKEINVITGGYQAEFGRATGGVVSIVTKSGGNEFHGSVFGSVQPLQLSAPTVGRLGESLALRRRTDSLLYDLGFELGGPIWKNKIWFYIGFAPTTTVFRNEKVVRRRVYDAMSGGARALTDYRCGSYLSSELLCRAGAASAKETEELSAYTEQLDEMKRLYNGIAKLQFNLSPNHNITLGYVASPKTFEGYEYLDQFTYSNFRDFHQTTLDNTHDLMARYVGKFFEHKLQVEMMYGFHYQRFSQTPDKANSNIAIYYSDRNDPYALADFEPIAECQRMSNGFNPCPLTLYQRNGFGSFQDQTLQRHQAMVSATAFLSLFGNHAIKLGADFEHLRQARQRQYSGTDYVPGDVTSGHRVLQTTADGSRFWNFAEFGRRGPDGELERLNGFYAETYTNNYSIYLRDSWNVSFAQGLVLNAGLRWELQEIFAADGSRQIFIPDNVAPRLGAVWDFTQKGYAKLYANYGRFYQSVPMTINDRQFSGEGTLTGAPTTSCPRAALQPGGRLLPYAGTVPGAECLLSQRGDDLNGGAYGQVMPGLKGQFIDEVVAGLDYDVGWDVVLGVGYIYRTLGNIIEDMSADGGNNYLIANPTYQVDPDRVTELESDINRLRTSGAAPADINRAEARLLNYRSLSNLVPPAVRSYHALVLKAQKRLSNRVSVLANYTYSRTLGNYPGTYDAVADENVPNFSANYDLVDLLANKTGPLPTDRPHNLKLLGTYEQPLPGGGSLNMGLTFSAYSGRPINVLGAHAIYGNSAVYILPRGSGGRTPTVTQFDVHVGYDQPLPRGMSLSLYADVINLFNQRAVASVDDDYTYSVVNPVVNGKTGDLLRLRDSTGQVISPNVNFGQPTAFQAPLYLRLGARLAF